MIGYDREVNDWYCEPAWAVEALAAYIDFNGQAIWDPAAGGGTIPAVFADAGNSTIASDIVDRGAPDVQIHDFLGCEQAPLFVSTSARLSIITNPPYKHSEAFIRRALPLIDHRLAVLVPTAFLASRARFDLFTLFPPSDVLVFCERPSMPPGAKIAELGPKAFKGGMTDFIWLIWTRPHDRETRMRWIEPRQKAERA